MRIQINFFFYLFIHNCLKINAIILDPTQYESIQYATSLISTGLMDYYNGLDYGQTIGKFVYPYYWWQSGAAWGSILDYSFYMKNNTFDKILNQALLFQVGDNWDYMPANETLTEGNDDQAFWGFTVMAAAERNFTNSVTPQEEPRAQWLYLAQAVYSRILNRWDTNYCGGGLRWQIFTFNNGYDYKNSVSNGGLFVLAARLARFTNNDTYVETADMVWDWMTQVNLITENHQHNWLFVHDGINIANCSKILGYQWTYNQALFLVGSAYLYNYTNDEKWLVRVEHLLNSSIVFFDKNNVLYEASCENNGNCNNDQRSFKAYFARFLGLTSILVPSTYERIRTLLLSSADAAADSCSGGIDGYTCGMNWRNHSYDGSWGLGEQMSALEIIQNLLVADRPAPYTSSSFLTNDEDVNNTVTPVTPWDFQNPKDEQQQTLKVGTKGKVGAGIITSLVGLTMGSVSYWLVL